MKNRNNLSNIRTEGGILPHDMLMRIQSKDSKLPGISPSDYHLDQREKLNEEINRAWSILLDKWRNFEKKCHGDPASNSKTGHTRDSWLLPILKELGYGWLPKGKSIEIDGKSFAVSHLWNNIPIHLLGANVNIDSRQSGVAGAAKLSPHGLVQEVLNRSDQFLWGIVSNGLKFRLLRDYHSLTRQSYIEFDLQAIMQGGNFNEFVLFWMICHQSRIETENLHDSWMEKWFKLSKDEGVRALSKLRGRVKEAIEIFGSAFISHSSNKELIEKLRSGNLDPQEYYRQLLRLVYRLIFLFVTEERDVLLFPNTEEYERARKRYDEFYSTRRLRYLAERLRGSGHGDLWLSLKTMMSLVYDGCPELAIPALGSRLWSDNACKDIQDTECSNEFLLEAIRKLTNIQDIDTTFHVNWKNIGSEELGSVYESLLELHPNINLSVGTFKLGTESINERKHSGTFYTPTELVEVIVHTALDPVIDEACKGSNPIENLLDLKVCDPACGSGHFLLAAARRISRRLAILRVGGNEPSPKEVQHALREVISRCIYGVDVNPMAVELCKVSLWMESMDPGSPLSFLDSHIQCGNSILGATPKGMKNGISNSAFTLLNGDDKILLNKIKERNEKFRSDVDSGQIQFAMIDKLVGINEENDHELISITDQIEDDTFEDIFTIRKKEKLWKTLSNTEKYNKAWLLADAWCSAYFWPKNNIENAEAAITEERWYQILEDFEKTPDITKKIIDKLVIKHRFFHWHLAFPHVFKSDQKETASKDSDLTGYNGGFDCILGNPPWVRQQLLRESKSILSSYESFSGTADTYTYFIELSLRIVSNNGIIGLITPNKWLRAHYAENLRRYLLKYSQIILIVDCVSSDTLFPGATTYPAVIIFKEGGKNVYDDRVTVVKAAEVDRNEKSIIEIINNNKISISSEYLNEKGWVLEDDSVNRLLYKLRNSFPKLIEIIGKKPIRGVMTLLNDAYYFDNSKYEAHISNFPNEQSLFRKIHRGRDIKRWNTTWNGSWQLFIDSSSSVNWPWSSAECEKDAELIFRNNYPGIFEHTKMWEQKLRKRTNSGKFWWELPSRAEIYDKILNEPKIISQEISTYSRFSIEYDGQMVNNTVVSIPTSDLYVLGVLNSRVTRWLMHRSFKLLQSDVISMDVEGLCKVPIPNVDEKLNTSIVIEVRNCLSCKSDHIYEYEKRLNDLIYQAFELSKEEVSILENSLPPRDPLIVIQNQHSS